MKRILLILFTLAIAITAKSQLHISGKIQLTKEWSSSIYILRLDHIDLNYGELIDTLHISKEGDFNYTFRSDGTDGLLYKLVLPPKGETFRTTRTGTDDNYFLLSTEEHDSLVITAESDSLYYSLKIKGGTINQSLLTYRNHARPFYEIARKQEDLILGYSDKAQGYKKEIIPRWMNQIDEFKISVSQTLDTANSASMVLAGLLYLNSAYLGILPSDIIKKHLPKVAHLDIPIVRNTIELAESTATNRKGLFLPDIGFNDRQGNPHSLHEVARKLTVIDFWASWCNPCRQANKSDLPELYESFKDDPDKQLISISIDTNADKWKKAIDVDGLAWPQYVDESRAFANLLSVHAVPLYLVLDENKKIVYETISVYHLKQFLSNMGEN